jgi:hypothetical protein
MVSFFLVYIEVLFDVDTKNENGNVRIWIAHPLSLPLSVKNAISQATPHEPAVS